MVGCRVGCYSPSLPKTVVESFWPPHEGIVYFPYNESSQKVRWRPMQSKTSVLRFGRCSLIYLSVLQEKWYWRLQGLWRLPAATGARPNYPVMQPHTPEPLHCPQVQIKNLQISTGSHWLWLENQAANNPVPNAKLKDQINMLDKIRACHHVDCGEKRFHRGSHRPECFGSRPACPRQKSESRP